MASPSTPPTTPPTIGPTFDDLEAGAVVWEALAEEEEAEELELRPGSTEGVGPPSADDSAASVTRLEACCRMSKDNKDCTYQYWRDSEPVRIAIWYRSVKV